MKCRKGKKLYCFFGQWCYQHKSINCCILRLKEAIDELCETLGKCPVKKKEFFKKNY